MACISRTPLPALVLLLALALGTGLVLAAGAPEDEGNGSPADDGVWETEGDWVVEDGEDLVYENLTLIVNGNLTVDFGGRLTLRGVKVTMNLTDDLQFWVRVRTGGEMLLSDMDGNASIEQRRFMTAAQIVKANTGVEFTGVCLEPVGDPIGIAQPGKIGTFV